ncbi:MAG TPA: pilus assembly protein PilM, partial [Tepidisphaeraceae bacterium]|nr:pilus assembly protein PilM [Tepidisphaeraceae bacterium]
MKLGSSNVLGIALADRTIAVAQVGGKSDAGQGSQAAIFTLPADVSIDKPEAVGNALAGFLKQKGFSASRVVVGVPAKWLMAVEKDVPPASKEQMRSMLRLQAERLSLADSGEVVFDFAGEHQANRPGNVLLVAMLKKQLDRVTQIAEAAGLTIVAVTPTTLALASVSARANKAASDRPMVVLAGHGAEIVWQRQGMPRMLRH